MNIIDYTQVEFTNIVVLRRAEDKVDPNGKRRVRWLCRCKCGEEFIARSERLHNNPDVVCRKCAYKTVSKKNQKSIVGQKYGRLLVIDEIRQAYEPTKVVCVCDCGKQVTVSQTDVINHHTQSCGCLQSERASTANYKDRSGQVTDSGIKLIKPLYKNEHGVWVYQCQCGMCGEYFEEIPARLLDGHKVSCGCTTRSSGEQYVRMALVDIGCEFAEQYSFDDLVDKRRLRFDFCVMNHGVVLYLIEYDGAQHYRPVDIYGGEEQYNEQHKRDMMKDAYCKEHNIPLLRIPYYTPLEDIKKTIIQYQKSVTTTGLAQ